MKKAFKLNKIEVCLDAFNGGTERVSELLSLMVEEPGKYKKRANEEGRNNTMEATSKCKTEKMDHSYKLEDILI